MFRLSKILMTVGVVANAFATNPLLAVDVDQKSVSAVSQFDALIPVISLSDFYHPERHADFVQSLGKAFQEHGFVAVVDANIDPSVLDCAQGAVKDFFSQDLGTKQAIQSGTNNGERGYVTRETGNRQPLHVLDFKEILHIGRELTAEQQARLNYPKNIWPENSELKDSMIPLFHELERAMQPIAEAAAEYLGESPKLFPEMMHEGEHLLRSLHYLRTDDQNTHWAAEHTDMNFLTLVSGGASEGLQVQLKDGTWVDVLVPRDAIVINVGDSLEHLTNGFYRAGVHRVISKPEAKPERWSIVFHGHTRHSLDMSPLRSAIEQTGGVQQFPTAKGWELLYAQIAAVGRASRPMLEELAKSGVIERQIEYGKASEKVMRILAKEKLASEAVLAELARK